jgi:hypothetical protein
MSIEILNAYSAETAYTQADYPYGRVLRCRRRVWIDYSDRHGYRMTYQTNNPKVAGERWNKPSSGQYAKIHGVLARDTETDHVNFLAVSEYDDHDRVLQYIARLRAGVFGVDRLASWCGMKARYAERGARGEIVWAVNGVARPVTEDDLARYRADVAGWHACLDAIATLA